ncbi:uncharacterized protein LOC123532004 [Mercenaria mercenaria]|uniref:uncharacterized protein LOC123532004 n=1 Tax=Mercenaria mercenaria TaxID=6596 RepID=UPI00234EB313|nr:uncharacterized protein LOC123532004 [Mercenaria mercenaria]
MEAGAKRCDSEGVSCDLCGKEKAVTAFCVDCKDLICEKCFAHNCLPEPLKHHRLMQRHKMPKMTDGTYVYEKCDKHNGETKKFYCEVHREICCRKCISTLHKRCNIRNLGDVIAEKDKESKENLKMVENLLRRQEEEVEDKVKSSERYVKAALEQLDKHRHKINKHFDKLKKEIEEEANNTKKKNKKKMNNLKDTCAAMQNDIEEIKVEIFGQENRRKSKQSFADVNANYWQVDHLKSKLERIQTQTKIKKVKFCQSRMSTSITLRKDILGYLQIYEEQNDDDNDGNQDNADNNMGNNDDGNEDSKSNSPCKNCETGNMLDCQKYQEIELPKLLQTSETTVAILDYYQSKVSLHTKSNPKHCANVLFSTGPWDFTKIEENTLAVTLPHERKIKFLHVHNGIKEADEIQTPGFCRSIAYVCNSDGNSDGNFLVVTFTEPAGLKLLCKSGEVLRDIPMIEAGKTLFRAPSSVAVAERTIFVTDPVMNTVTRMATDRKKIGKIEEILRHNDLIHPSFVSYSNNRLLISLRKGLEFFSTTCDFTNIETKSCTDDNVYFLGRTQATDFNNVEIHGIAIHDSNIDDRHRSNADEVRLSSDIDEDWPREISRRKQCIVS